MSQGNSVCTIIKCKVKTEVSYIIINVLTQQCALKVPTFLCGYQKC